MARKRWLLTVSKTESLMAVTVILRPSIFMSDFTRADDNVLKKLFSNPALNY